MNPIILQSSLSPSCIYLCKYLGSDIPEQVLYVLSDESILHDCLPVHFQDLLKLIDVVVLGTKHGQNWPKKIPTWYAVTRLVIATISLSFLYGFASWESKGLIPDFINMFASTKNKGMMLLIYSSTSSSCMSHILKVLNSPKYLRHVVRRGDPDSS